MRQSLNLPALGYIFFKWVTSLVPLYEHDSPVKTGNEINKNSAGL